MSRKKEISYIVASDVNPRDGVGLETYIDGNLVFEIFRDDSERRTYATLFSPQVDLDVLETSISTFKERVGLSYIDYPDDEPQA